MKEEIKIFFTALMFYTRIPCPKIIDHHPDRINQATRYFPLMGWVVGGISFLVYWVSTWLLGQEIGVVLSILAGVLVTGAFHEDGLADAADGFGGGWTKEHILEIMKDSRIGAFGVVALVFLFGLKYFGLHGAIYSGYASTTLFHTIIIFISYHALARLTAIQVAFVSTYSRMDEESKAKPIAKKHGVKEMVGAYFFGLAPLAVLAIEFPLVFLVLVPCALIVMYAKYYFERWIDGYTGDCLGAVEQVAEVVILLSYIALWKFM